MLFLNFNGINLPIHDDWKSTASKTTYSGSGGLLDVRIQTTIDACEAKIERLRKSLENYFPNVYETKIGTFNCIVCRYTEGTSSVSMYSFDLGDSQELAAVYVFNSGFEQLCNLIHRLVLASASV